MKLILDTSNNKLLIALARNEIIFDRIEQEANKILTEITVEKIKTILIKNNSTMNDIEEIIICGMPGSFTGIRVSLTIAKIINIVKPIKLFVINNLLAQSSYLNNNISIIDARNEKVYLGVFENGKNILENKIYSLLELENIFKKYSNYDLYGDTYLINKEAIHIDKLKNMLEISKTITAIKNIDEFSFEY